MADQTKDEGTLPDVTPSPAPQADGAAPVVAADPAPAVEPTVAATHATEQAEPTTSARRARKLVTPAVASAEPAPTTPPAPAVEPTVAAPKAAEAVAAPDASPVSKPVPAKARKPLASRVTKPEPAPAAKPVKAMAAKPLPARTVATKVAPAQPKPAQPKPPKPKPAPVAARGPGSAKPPVTAPRPGTGIPHAMVPAPLKTRVNHAAAPAASRKEHPIMTTANEFSDKFQSAFKDASEKAKAAFEKSQAAFGDAGEFAKGNVEAVVESSKILASGLQELTKGYAAEGKSAMEALTVEIKELASAKSPTEFFEKHTALMRKQFDAAVAASSKHSEAVLKLANEAFQPISNRVSLAVEKMKVAA